MSWDRVVLNVKRPPDGVCAVCPSDTYGKCQFEIIDHCIKGTHVTSFTCPECNEEHVTGYPDKRYVTTAHENSYPVMPPVPCSLPKCGNKVSLQCYGIFEDYIKYETFPCCSDHITVKDLLRK